MLAPNGMENCTTGFESSSPTVAGGKQLDGFKATAACGMISQAVEHKPSGWLRRQAKMGCYHIAYNA